MEAMILMEVLILAVVIYIAIKIKKCGESSKVKESKGQETKDDSIEKYPYKKIKLLTGSEYAFYMKLKFKCDKYNMLICPKVRLEDFIDVTYGWSIKYRLRIRSRHVDFLICDSKLNILCGIELDGESHESYKQQKIDKFKNNLFQVIKIPLHRVKVSDGIKFEVHIDSILGEYQTAQKEKLDKNERK